MPYHPLRSTSRPHRLGVLAAAAVAAMTCSMLTPTQSVATPTGASAERSEVPDYQDPRLSTQERVADLLSRMTLAEKIGQMTQAERGDVAADPTKVKTWGLGSVLSGGGSVPEDNTPTGWADMVDAFQAQALQTRLGIPLLYGVDSVHGHANLKGATVFPHNIGLGATRDPGLVRKIGEITAEETRASGPQWSFAPCVCVARDDRWGRTYESFGEDPDLVISMETIIDGLQGRRARYDDPSRVLATAKHFAGDGLTTFGTGHGDYTIDQGIAEVDRQTFRQLALAPYGPAIDRHHVGSIMPSFSSVDWTEDGLGNPIKMHANRELISGVLKGEMGFDGLVISDWLAIQQLPGTYDQQVATSVNAGVDMFMEPAFADKFIATLTAAVESGAVPMPRIDDAVSRILTVKFDLGLFENPYTDRRNIDEIGSEQHRKVARRAVAQSQVLLKNEGRTLPIATKRPVYVAGSNADNIGNQAGGWTLTWQGGSKNVIPGDTILDGLRDGHRDVTFSETALEPVPRNAVGVVVVGETPYAEGFGDVGGPRWGWDPADGGVQRPAQTMMLNEADKAAVSTVCSRAARCVVVVVSGRPMILEPTLLAEVDAVVASWLPGSEGAGVADVLLGKRPFTGKLPVTWPRTIAQEPINIGDANYDPLYPYGWGLRTR
ncbi:glycoside hydrolase family 3 protein [Nocardioides sp.]|uniref:glycoside hydrolase family 3 protein n=1 Tax=Nocardioides sp. TaxID=35761 RepID=UPI002BA45F73|nr:glycoside hydrolase family 3 protein [Nocardioides sp.]HXH77843.1 glycoside hydrolase family 3 protein [Nocardioides sp.]